MIVRIVTFTRQGEEKARQIFEDWQEMIPQYRDGSRSLDEWTGECFRKHLPILFVGACGIAVRTIAPYVKDKLTDSAVLVMDEKGWYVIPLLAGHVGGANELARSIAKRAGATPVLTTATDVEGMFSVDEFARKNGLRIINRDGIRKVSAKLLRGEEVTITWEKGIEVEAQTGNGDEMVTKRETFPKGLRYVSNKEDHVDVRIVTEAGYRALRNKEGNEKCGQSILLVTKEFVLGIGCRKGKTFDELQGFLNEAFVRDKSNVNWEGICGIASIDLKAKEEGIWELAQFYHLPYLTFSAGQLERVEGDFEASEFVKGITGVDNVCERAALCLAGAGGELVRKKNVGQGITMAIAKRKVRLVF